MSGPRCSVSGSTRLVDDGAEHGGHITLRDEHLYLEDIESVEAEDEGRGSRVRLRNGLIIGGLTGAAIVAALATVRYRRRKQPVKAARRRSAGARHWYVPPHR